MTLKSSFRATDGSKLDKSITAAVNAILDRAEAIIDLGPAKEKTQRRQLIESWDLHWSALISTRAALQGVPCSQPGCDLKAASL